MSYEFQSKYKKTNQFNPDESPDQPHHCCHSHPEKLNKKIDKSESLSSSHTTDQYSYKSPYAGGYLATAKEDHHCCHEDIQNSCADLQHKNAQERQQKSSDFIKQKREEEERKNSS
jgi:hypothetical protein